MSQRSLYFVSSFAAGRRVLRSFPTRRSSDLALDELAAGGTPTLKVAVRSEETPPAVVAAADLVVLRPAGLVDLRSEEHTSELQSPCNLVCRLLLEKKKKLRN